MSAPALALTLAAALISQAPPTDEDPPFTDAQLDYLEELRESLRREAAASGGGSAATAAPAEAPSRLEIRADAYMKWLYRNNASQGCVTYGNPHPSGDNYSGDNGACPELGLTIIGRPHPKVEGGFRIQSRYGQDFADWFENGDKRATPDASGESLGQNHSAPLQLRGIYVRVNEPLPFIDWFLAGSSDLAYWDEWTVGKSRFIDRNNGKGVFLKGHVGSFLDVLIARIAMSKLFGTANYNALEDALVTNPFWARDAVYAVQLATPARLWDGVQLTLNGALSLDEEADARDPDAAGSTNTVDPRDQVTAVASRFTGINASLALDLTRFEWMRARALVAFSHNDPNPEYVTNLNRGGLGFSNIVFDRTTDVAATLRFELPDLFGEGRALRAEYFNVGAEFNAVAGARREADVLLTDGFFGGGQLPTLNLANELMDFNDAFYESIVGWHGATVLLEQKGDVLDASFEGTFITYNTNAQDRDMDRFPGFGGFTGYTDTDLFSYANTNDRGRDPRMVYARDQDRRSLLFTLQGAVKPDWWRGARIEAKAKLILDEDGRDADFDADDYSGTILQGRVSIAGEPLDALRLRLGFQYDHWDETARSGTYAGGTPTFVDYTTQRLRPWIDFEYSLGPFSARYHIEVLKKVVETTDPTLDLDSGLIWRSIGSLGAQF